MNQTQYLAGQVSDFADWLASRLNGAPIHFSAPGTASYVHLHHALSAYQWPPRAKAPLPISAPGFPYRHPVVPPLLRNSNLATNAALLATLQRELRKAYSGGTANPLELAGVVAAIFHWGGVYTSKGNKSWLLQNHLALHTVLRGVELDHSRGDDTTTIAGLRFNSGMTKVYSLLIDDFIIYDSRVAAALAWLVHRWWVVDLRKSVNGLPPLLRFGCLPGNGKMAPFRNPDKAVFTTLRSNPAEHYMWNVRANWLLGAAFAKANRPVNFPDLRSVEAALFQMGLKV